MLRARSQLDGALAMVALLHQQITDALAGAVAAYPIVTLNIAIVFVAHLFLRSEITSTHAAYQGSSLPFKTFIVVTLPSGCRTVMF